MVDRCDIVGFGESSVDHLSVVPAYPASGGKVPMAHFERQGGGQIATAMVACARLGARARFLGVVGEDDDGRFALDGLRAERVDVAHVRVVAGAATRTAVILIDARSGERTVIFRFDERLRQGAAAALPDAALDGARALHVDATMPEVALELARRARARGITVSIDVDRLEPGVERLLAEVDVCITSEGFPEALTGRRDRREALAALRALGPRLVGSTLGPAGAVLLEGDHLVHGPGFEVPVVDTTGCGDVFHAAFLVALLEEQPLRAALRFANAAAALKCRRLGAQPGIPTRAEVDRFLAERA